MLFRSGVAWLGGFGTRRVVGVEGTGAYGAGLARYLMAQGQAVVEVDRPDRKARRAAGKSPNLSLVGEPEQAAKVALRALGHRHAGLSEEIAELEALIAPLVEQSPLSAGADVLFSADPLVPLGSIPDGVTRGGPVGRGLELSGT